MWAFSMAFLCLNLNTVQVRTAGAIPDNAIGLVHLTERLELVPVANIELEIPKSPNQNS